jgi:hypothetical protein
LAEIWKTPVNGFRKKQTNKKAALQEAAFFPFQEAINALIWGSKTCGSKGLQINPSAPASLAITNSSSSALAEIISTAISLLFARDFKSPTVCLPLSNGSITQTKVIRFYIKTVRP